LLHLVVVVMAGRRAGIGNEVQRRLSRTLDVSASTRSLFIRISSRMCELGIPPSLLSAQLGIVRMDWDSALINSVYLDLYPYIHPELMRNN